MTQGNNRQQLIRRVTGTAVTYCAPDGYVEDKVFYSRQKPKEGEYLYCVSYGKCKAEYMEGHEAEPVYAWRTAPHEESEGICITFTAPQR